MDCAVLGKQLAALASMKVLLLVITRRDLGMPQIFQSYCAVTRAPARCTSSNGYLILLLRSRKWPHLFLSWCRCANIDTRVQSSTGASHVQNYFQNLHWRNFIKRYIHHNKKKLPQKANKRDTRFKKSTFHTVSPHHPQNVS